MCNQRTDDLIDLSVASMPPLLQKNQINKPKNPYTVMLTIVLLKSLGTNIQVSCEYYSHPIFLLRLQSLLVMRITKIIPHMQLKTNQYSHLYKSIAKLPQSIISPTQFMFRDHPIIPCVIKPFFSFSTRYFYASVSIISITPFIQMNKAQKILSLETSIRSPIIQQPDNI